MSRISFSRDQLDRAGDCIKWLMKNVGPLEDHHGGSYVRGVGWEYWVVNNPEILTVHVELTADVDEETQILFMLKWA